MASLALRHRQRGMESSPGAPNFLPFRTFFLRFSVLKSRRFFSFRFRFVKTSFTRTFFPAQSRRGRRVSQRAHPSLGERRLRRMEPAEYFTEQWDCSATSAPRVLSPLSRHPSFLCETLRSLRLSARTKAKRSTNYTKDRFFSVLFCFSLFFWKTALR